MALLPRRKRLLGLLAALAAVAILSPLGVNAASGDPADDDPAPAAESAAPAAQHGQLSVCGTRLCDASGDHVQLRGMSTHGLQWYSQCLNDASLDALAYDWGADVVRLSMYIQEDGYETDPAGFTARMHELIDEVTARGQYVIVDWHMLTPGDPHYNLERAETFFTEIAREHGDQDNIFYEVANEPNGVSWSRIKSYHEAIIPVIRQYDDDGIILLGTPHWSSLGLSDGSNEQEVINDQVDAENIMYTFHFYAASHDDYHLDGLARAADQIPMFVTEFGTQNYSGEGANDFAMSQRYLDLMEEKGISWVNWNYSDDHRSGAVFEPGTCPGGPFDGDGGNLKEAGEWIRDRILEGGGPSSPPTDDPTEEPTEDPTGDTGTWRAGEYYAAGDLASYGGATYRCVQSHTALTGWEPPNVPALWTPV
ncbi:cellulase family glycosylhydrolase [Glycomyces sp. A-F 0318]|uniref:cellulase family glycosylhydrolase n=1 Tax=Glycomyces amatae TaxID=2881355 RepID=UPI001E612762|nr:cellulase family glycosylhydrolase [Glycomyces amatae]MCD0446808.1 cellulase family glycosylhydrolase [Glycomyces amatae]